jgi:hypothetical protein
MTKRLDPKIKEENRIAFSKRRSIEYSGENNPFYGKHHSEESIEKNRNAHVGKPSSRKGAVLSDETKEKIRKARVGRFGKVRLPTDLKMVIPLTNGKVALIDSDDYEKLNTSLWCITKNHQIEYATRGSGNGTCETMHRAIMGIPEKGLMIDHINGNGLDNRKCNLRVVTNRVNCANHHHKQRSSKYPGISWNKRTEKWNAQVQISGKHIHLGTFSNEEAAYRAYLKAVHPVDSKLIETATPISTQCPSQEAVEGE